MAKFKPKAVQVEALQWDGTAVDAHALVAWVQAGGMLAYFDNSQYPDALYVVVNTRKGPQHMSPKDWLVQGPSGKFTVLEPDEFTANFSQA